MTSGIYYIENTINGKKYVGKSTNLEQRWIKHKSRLLLKNHFNNYLQRAWNRYGENNFKFKIIEECESEKLSEKEAFYISYFNTKNNGYNLTDGGEGLLGHACSEETKKKISESCKGKTLSDIHKKKISSSEKGKIVSEETRSKISKANYGKRRSEEAKKKMSKAKQGKYFGENHPMYGKKHSKEAKEKMSESQKLRRQIEQKGG